MFSLIKFLPTTFLWAFGFPSAALGFAGSPEYSSYNITHSLGSLLSQIASISTNISTAPRWSDYYAPKAGYVVHAAEEEDVAKTVKFCNDHGLKFLAQSGGHGAAKTFHMRDKDVVIDLRGLNSVMVSANKDQMYVGGGTTAGEWLKVAYANRLQVLVGGNNCVGMGFTLGGGLSKWMNFYGLSTDNLVSVNLITAAGELTQVSDDQNPDLMWALRGAGPNFGIVTSAVIKAYPTIDEGRIWNGELTFSGDKLERFVDVFNSLHITPNMTIYWGFSHFPVGEPVITANIFFMNGDAEAGQAAFQPLFDLQPESAATQILTYDHINDNTNALCEDGGLKTAWHVGLKTIDYNRFQQVWDEYVDFVASTGLNYTTILLECYSNDVIRQIGSAKSSYPHRDINYYAWVNPFWTDPSQNAIVEAYGARVRELWSKTSGFDQPKIYINFAHGDEPLEVIYGESLPRLRELKQQWDPQGVFNQWFPIV